MDDLLNFDFGSLSLNTILHALLALVICLVLIRIIMRLIKRAMAKSSLELQMQKLVSNTLRTLLWIIAALTIASTLGIPVTSLVAVFSVLGLAASLAAQNSLANLAGGLMILTTRPFKIGDYIEAAGIGGTVITIGLAYTRIKTADNQMIHVPNSSISAEKITNYSSEETRRINITVSASYESQIETVKAALYAALSSQSAILTEPAPFVNVLTYGENSIQYTMRAWVKTSAYWDTYFALLEKIKQVFDTHGVEMNYNHLNIHLLKDHTQQKAIT